MATAGRRPHLHWQDLQQAKRKVEEARSMALQVSFAFVKFDGALSAAAQEKKKNLCVKNE
ncbi:hypothetical protein EJB05_20141 [Eragrostis curvula]|uniref:Uncharacterized protein n=1 Tax=Eragrostis curvula TaxID=38414 RepID=A0A5J9UZG9_9POAL|nr:hypothetical protein EJB05_20141 [Eragrostis curvula]